MLLFSVATNNIYTTYRSCKEIKIDYRKFLLSVHCRMILGMAMAMALSWLFHIDNNNFGCFAINILTAISCVGIIGLFVGLNKNERMNICNKLKLYFE